MDGWVLVNWRMKRELRVLCGRVSEQSAQQSQGAGGWRINQGKTMSSEHTDGWTGRGRDRQMMDGQREGQTMRDGQREGQIGGWKDRQMNRWMDGWMGG